MKKKLNFHSGFHLTKCSHGLHLNQVPFPNDRISSLPVEVLSIILSSLSLKEMVRTNILSKQWINLWTNTPVLEFYLGIVCEDIKKADYTVKLVNHVLQQHKGLYLKEFRIHCVFQDYNQVDIDEWLDFALAKKVEILELDFSFSGFSLDQDYNYVFPIHWFTSGTNGRVLQYKLKLLKSLSLKSVNVTSEAIHFFLRNCPFLERLQVVGSKRIVDLVISDPSLVLKYLQIKYCRQLKVMSISNINLVSLDTTVRCLLLKNLPMLVELSILGFSNSLTGILSLNATCLIHLTSLELCALTLQEVTELPSNLAQMTKLKRLVIGCVPEYDESLTVLLYIIKSCKHLEEFVLQMGWYASFNHLSRSTPYVERMSFDSLKVFEFHGYYGCFSDVELIMHVAMNSPRLEKIIIDSFNVSKIKLSEIFSEVERESRRFALKHIEDLKQSKHIQPHVDVFIV